MPSRSHPPGRAAALALAVGLGACTLPPIATPTPSPSPTPPPPTPIATPTPRSTPSPPVSAAPTLDASAIPAFRPGDVVATTVDGLRVRRLPGTQRQIVVQRLPAGAELLVVMGPIVVDGFGWYEVVDADADEPEFDGGWIAAGVEPDPLLSATGSRPEPNPYLGGVAGVGDAEHGPVGIPDDAVAMRWLALDPAGAGCRFAVDLFTDPATPVPAVRATVGASPAPGRLFGDFFADRPELRGQVFLRVASDCAWALAFERLEP